MPVRATSFTSDLGSRRLGRRRTTSSWAGTTFSTAAAATTSTRRSRCPTWRERQDRRPRRDAVVGRDANPRPASVRIPRSRSAGGSAGALSRLHRACFHAPRSAFAAERRLAGPRRRQLTFTSGKAQVRARPPVTPRSSATGPRRHRPVTAKGEHRHGHRGRDPHKRERAAKHRRSTHPLGRAKPFLKGFAGPTGSASDPGDSKGSGRPRVSFTSRSALDSMGAALMVPAILTAAGLTLVGLAFLRRRRLLR